MKAFFKGMLLAVVCAALYTKVFGAVPEQSQASTLAVPTPVVYPYASAMVVVQCREVIAVVFVTHDGELVPQHWPDLTPQELDARLDAAAPADKTFDLELTCPAEKST